MKSKQDFLKEFENTKEQIRTWYWEPFHKNGLHVLEWIEKKADAEKFQIPFEKKLEIIEGHLENISVIAAPEKIRRLSKVAPNIIDKYGRLIPLDPSVRILQTLKNIKNSDFFILKISELKTCLNNWQPLLKSNPENLEIQSIWTSTPDILARYQNLGEWEKLEILEAIFGLTKSHTTLKFQRIDGPPNLP